MKSSWNPWPVGLVLFLCCILAGVVSFSIFAHRQAVDLVTEDYYQKEIAFQQQIERQQRTAQLEDRPEWVLDLESRTATLSFEASTIPDRGELHLYRPSSSALDLTVPVALDSNSSQRVDLAELSPGLWIAQLTWTSGSEDYYHEERWNLPTPAGVQ
ncbi:MAG: FixH family protein [Thermoanaerobaculia bacterium]|nr:FixH family protein [Thermoanaerobaculia bacterium]